MIRHVRNGVVGVDRFGILLDEEYTSRLMFIADTSESTPDAMIYSAIDVMFNKLCEDYEDG